MPDPKTLKVGDRMRFTEMPAEWSQEGYTIHASTIRFMKRMIRRKWPSRIREIDEWGYPWIRAILIERGRRVYHHYGIYESTGWRRVENRRRRRTKHAAKRKP